MFKLMSVLACNRRGCEGIMCDRLSHEHGYICDGCYQELVNKLARKGCGVSITKFMNAERKPAHDSDIEDAEFVANRVFPNTLTAFEDE